MLDRLLSWGSCLHPSDWPIGRKVALGPAVVIILLSLSIYVGWSTTNELQTNISKSYQRHAALEETAHILPHRLARIQRDLYKLTIWAQIDVKGDEVTSTLESIDDDVDAVRSMLLSLEDQPLFTPLEEAVTRYIVALEQALILTRRSASLGATATRGIEHVYLTADEAAHDLADLAKEAFDLELQEAQAAWQQLVVKFLLMIGAVAMIIPLLGVISDRIIARPIKQLACVVDQFRHGRLNVDVPWTLRKDEVGLVARAIETFRENLIRNQVLEREREQLNHELERKVEQRTKQLEEQKERLARSLEKEHELNGLQRQFVSMVCHEFRTPLAIIDGNAQRIIKRFETLSPDRVMQGLSKTRTAVTRLTELMESVLSASKLEAGAIKMELAPCNLAEMIDEVANNYREVNPGYKISTDVVGLPEFFIVDLKLMRQVISNLLSNAIKYSTDGSQVRVEASSCSDQGVSITVSDQGVGIPKDELEKLFQRFFRASTSTGIAGTGIGLHMVRTLVDMHGGRIDIASEVGVGTTFTVYLPYHDANRAGERQGVITAA